MKTIIKIKEIVTAKDKSLRKYPESFWMCREDREFKKCTGVKVCIQMYPNLICEKGFRPLPGEV